jgi:Tripartite tricarboxylate transporter TctB family
MQIKSQRDFCSGLLFVVVGVAFAVGASHYSMGSSVNPGAGYFPLILSLMMAILGTIVLFKSLTIETEGGDPIGKVAWRPLVAIVGSVAVFGATVQPLGLMVAVPLVVLITSLASDEFKWLGVIINVVVLSLLAWLVCVHVLKLNVAMWPSALGR